MIRAYFVSDIHLKSMQERNGQKLLRFFHSLNANPDTRPSHVFLVGDIFDLWIGSHAYFISRFQPLIDAIRALVNDGVTVHYFEGNHDLYLKDFWQNEVGAHVHADVGYFEIGDRVIRVEHGDLINPDDKGYLFLRGFLRSAPVVFCARRLPSGLVAAIGERASRASREYTSTSKDLGRQTMVKLIHRYAENAFMQKPFDFIITGHVHLIDDFAFEAAGRTARSVNLGSWFDRPRAFLLTADTARFIEIP